MNLFKFGGRGRAGRRAAFLSATAVLVAVAAAVTVSAASGSRSAAPKPASNQTLNVVMTINNPILDPTQWGTSASYTVQQNLFVNLTNVDQRTHKALPALATSWKSSKDFMTWTFNLRQDAKFADGHPITAADVVASMVRNYTVLNASQMQANGVTNAFPQGFISLPELQGALAVTKGQAPAIPSTAITAPSKYTVQLKLDLPRNDIPQRMAFPVWGITEASNVATSTPGNPWWYHAVGSGPFQLASFNAGQSLTLTPNPNWYGPKPRLKQVNFTMIPNTQTAEIAYEAGSVDFLKTVYSDVLNLESSHESELRAYVDNAVSVLLINSNGPTKDPHVVKALTLALDKKTLANKVLEGLPRPAITFTPPQWPGYSPKGFKPIGFDAAAAKAEFAKSGLDPSKTTIHLTYSGSQDPRAAQAIAQMWQQTLGVTVTVVPNSALPPANAPESQAINTYFQAQGPTFITPCSMVQRIKDILVTGAGANNVNINPSQTIGAALEPALEKCYTSPDSTVWSQVMSIENMNTVNQVFVPVFWNKDYFLVKPYVRNVQLGPTWNISNLSQVWIAQH
jgi:peptide/nickel transport system substrate-binding protein/oligopeptide transport system substrate-binding protein